MNRKINIGDILTVAHEIIDITGGIILSENQKVVVRDLLKTEAHWSKICPDIWVEEEVHAVYLEDTYGIWKLTTFKELL